MSLLILHSMVFINRMTWSTGSRVHRRYTSCSSIVMVFLHYCNLQFFLNMFSYNNSLIALDCHLGLSKFIFFYSNSRLVGAAWRLYQNLFFVFYKLTCWRSTIPPVSRLVLSLFLLRSHCRMEFNIMFGCLYLYHTFTIILDVCMKFILIPQ